MLMLARRLALVIGFLGLLSGIASGATWTTHTSGTTETLRAVDTSSIASDTPVSTSIYDIAVTLTSGTGEFRLKVVD